MEFDADGEFGDELDDDLHLQLQQALGQAPTEKKKKPRFHCAGSRRKDAEGKALCNYKAVYPWMGRCPGDWQRMWGAARREAMAAHEAGKGCGELFGCVPPRKGEGLGEGQSVASGASIRTFKSRERISTGIPEIDKVLGGGFLEENVLMLGAPPGTGKALAWDTPVPTPTGWTLQGLIRVGDLVIGADGLPARVIATTGRMYDRPCYRLTFSDGTSIVADENHSWVTLSHGDRQRIRQRDPEFQKKQRVIRPKRGTGERPYMAERNARLAALKAHLPQPVPSIRTTKEIAETILSEYDNVRLNHSIEQPQPAVFPEADLPVPPYTLGAWLGDGTTGAAQITSADPEILVRIRMDGFTISPNAAKMRFGVLGLRKGLKKTGAFLSKHIPDKYLRASVEQRLELLRGLMDTDGYVDRAGSCLITLTDKKLFEGVVELIRSFGIVAPVREHYKTCTNSKTRAKTLCYTTQFTAPFSVFHLSRKRTKQRTKVHSRYRKRYIKSAERIDSVPVCCIQIDRPDGLYVAGKQWIVTHNSTLLMQVMIQLAKQGIRPFFASGEMTLQSNIEYLSRIAGPDVPVEVLEKIGFYCDTNGINIHQAIDQVKEWKAKVFFLDSLQHAQNPDSEAGMGEADQTNAVMEYVSSFCQKKKVAGVLISHVTKDGDLQGSRKTQHASDGLLMIDRRDVLGEDGYFLPGTSRNDKSIIREFYWKEKSRQCGDDVRVFMQVDELNRFEPLADFVRMKMSRLKIA